jgi:hypothetical protein
MLPRSEVRDGIRGHYDPARGWPGFALVGVRREGATPQRPVPRIVLTLQAVAGQPRHCSRCGQIVGEVHDVTPREIRDLPILDAETWLIVPRARLKGSGAVASGSGWRAGALIRKSLACARGEFGEAFTDDGRVRSAHASVDPSG